MLIKYFYLIAGSARGQYEAKPVFWLATRAHFAHSGLPALIPSKKNIAY